MTKVATALLLPCLGGCSWLLSIPPDRMEDSHGQMYRAAIPVSVAFDDDFPADDKEVVVRAMSYWNEASGRSLFVLRHSHGEALILSESSRDIVDGHRTGKHYELASTYASDSVDFGRGREVLLAQVTFFERWGNLPTPERENVVRHELGHVLGLRHTEDEGCVMFRDSVPSDEPRQLCGGELSMIRQIYGSL